MTYKENSNLFLKNSNIPCSYTVADIIVCTLPDNSSTQIGYYIPQVFTSPPAMSEKTEIITAGISKDGYIKKDGYLYWSANNGIHRKLISGGNEEILFESTDSDWIYGSGFAVLDGARIVTLREYMIGNGDNPTDYSIKVVIRDFDSEENTIIGEMWEYDIDWYSRLFYFFVVTPNNKIIISSYVDTVPEEDSIFNFYVDIYDIISGELLCAYDSGGLNTNRWFQYPVNPPVIVGNKVYFSYHFAGYETEDPGYDSTPIILIADTNTNSATHIRPYYYGLNLAFLYMSAYNTNQGKIAYIYGRFNETEGHYGIMFLDIEDNSLIFPWETTYSGGIEPTDMPKYLLVGPNHTVYLVRKDGNIYSVDDLDIVLTTLPMDDYVYPMHISEEYAQPIKICNIVDENGIIWMVHDGDVCGYSINGSAPVVIDTNIPEPSASGHFFSPYVLVYLIDGELFVETNDYTLGVRIWKII